MDSPQKTAVNPARRRNKYLFLLPLSITIIALGNLSDVLAGRATGPYHGKISLGLSAIAAVGLWLAVALEARRPKKS